MAAAQASPATTRPNTAPDAATLAGEPETAGEAGVPEEYDRLILSALAAFKAGEWSRARRLFERAHGLHPTARTLRTIGMSAFNQGDLIGAVQNLEASLSDDRKPLTIEQQEHVRQLIDKADARLGRLRLLVQPAHATVLVDGKSPAFIGHDQVVLEPGRHELRIQADGHHARVQHVRVSARDRATLEIQLEPGQDEASMSAAAGPAASEAGTSVSSLDVTAHAAASSAERGGQGPNVAPWIAMGLGAAGLVTAGIVGGIAYGKRKDLDDACPARECGPANYDDVDSYNTLRVTSLVSLGVGLLGIGIGGTLLALERPDQERPDGARAARVRLGIGVGSVSLRGNL